jgi:hypothetical protein
VAGRPKAKPKRRKPPPREGQTPRDGHAHFAQLRNRVEGEITKGWNGQYHPLPDALQAAVPLWQLQFMHLTFDERSEIAKESSRVLMETGEAFLVRIKGKTAQAFNAIAKALAVLSFQPGGVRAFGMHWEAQAATEC